MKSHYWFTLVELIVVIAILAILGTISFISLIGYSQDARNSKVSSDMRSLITAIESQTTVWTTSLGRLVETPYLSYSIDNDINTFWSQTLWGSWELIDETSNYTVGTIDFRELKQSASDFYFPAQDGTQQEYLIATAISGETAYYQLWWAIHVSSWENRSIIKWTYIDEWWTFDADGLISESGATTPLINNAVISSEIFAPTRSLITWESWWWGGGGGGWASPGPAWAEEPFITWSAFPWTPSISLPDSLWYNVFSVDSSANNSNITIEVWDGNNTITTQFGADTITTWYGNNIINASNGINIITVWDGYNEINLGYDNSTITMWNGDNTITSLGWNLTIDGGDGNNIATLWYGTPMNITLGNGNNQISGTGWAFYIDIGNGNNTISPGWYGNHIISFWNGDNTFNGLDGSSIITTGTSGTANITFWWNQSQQLIWKWGDTIVNDFWRYGNNRISFANISDINNCTDVANNSTIVGSTATITSSHGTLEIHIQQSQTQLNCASTMIF